MARDPAMIDPRGPIGTAKVDLDTPALLVDLDVMDANIARIVAECREHRVAWRPHSKVHKTPEIAQRLITAGARGITCAKLGEAEVMAAAGICDILIANQIVGTTKIRQLIDLTGAANPIVAVDSVANVTALSDAASAQGKVLKVVIEVDVGMNRSGVEPGVCAAALAITISTLPGLRFAGVMAWEGHAATIADPAEKERTVAKAIGRLTASADACRRLAKGWKS
jgi:D-serine deaminase-like pyridoxal phosphate-dependent protein